MKLLADFFPVLLFFLAYKFYGIYVATGVAMAASLAQVGYHWLRHRKVENTHLVTLGLLLVLGGLTLLLQDKSFIMWKPTIVNWLFAVAFVATGLIGRKTLVERMMGHAIQAPAIIWQRVNWAWLNLYFANLYFVAEQELKQRSGLESIETEKCAELFQDDLLRLCIQAQGLESDWVNFKLFGILGLTLAFVILQALYLARYASQENSDEE